jgi:hypothetical protein
MELQLDDGLQNSVGGGKPKMRYYFSGSGWPVRRRPYAPPPRTAAEQTALVDLLQEVKNQHYVSMLKRGVPLRPGVLRLMDKALSDPLVKVSWS